MANNSDLSDFSAIFGGNSSSGSSSTLDNLSSVTNKAITSMNNATSDKLKKVTEDAMDTLNGDSLVKRFDQALALNQQKYDDAVNLSRDNFIKKYGEGSELDYQKQILDHINNEALNEISDNYYRPFDTPELVKDTLIDATNGAAFVANALLASPAAAADLAQHTFANAVNAVQGGLNYLTSDDPNKTFKMGDHIKYRSNLTDKALTPSRALADTLDEYKSDYAKFEDALIARQTAENIAKHSADIDQKVNEGSMGNTEAFINKSLYNFGQGLKEMVATPRKAASTAAQTFGSFKAYGKVMSKAIESVASAIAKNTGKAMPEAMNLAQKYINNPTALASMGISQDSDFINETINNFTDSELLNYPKFKEIYDSNKESGMSDKEAMSEARSLFKDKLYGDTSLFSAVVGGISGKIENKSGVQTKGHKAFDSRLAYATKPNLEGIQETTEGLETAYVSSLLNSDNYNALDEITRGAGQNYSGGVLGTAPYAAGGYLSGEYRKATNLKNLNKANAEALETAEYFNNNENIDKDTTISDADKQTLKETKKSFVNPSLNTKHNLDRNTDALTGIHELSKRVIEESSKPDNEVKTIQAQMDLINYQKNAYKNLKNIPSSDKSGESFTKLNKFVQALANNSEVNQAKSDLARTINSITNGKEDTDISKLNDTVKNGIRYLALNNPLSLGKDAFDYASKYEKLNQDEIELIKHNKHFRDLAKSLTEINSENKDSDSSALDIFLLDTLNKKVEFNNDKDKLPKGVNTKLIEGIFNNISAGYTLSQISLLEGSILANALDLDTNVSALKIDPTLKSLGTKDDNLSLFREAASKGSSNKDLISNLKKRKAYLDYSLKTQNLPSNVKNTYSQEYDDITNILKNPKDKSAIFDLLSIYPAGINLFNTIVDSNKFTNEELQTISTEDLFKAIKEDKSLLNKIIHTPELNSSEENKKVMSDVFGEDAVKAMETRQQKEKETEQKAQEEAKKEKENSFVNKAVNTAKNVASKTINTAKKVVGKSAEEKPSPETNSSGSEKTENTVSPESRTDKGSPVENNTSEPEINTQEVQENAETKPQTEESTKKQEQIPQEQNTEQIKEAEPKKKVNKKTVISSDFKNKEREYAAATVKTNEYGEFTDNSPITYQLATVDEILNFKTVKDVEQAAKEGKIIYRIDTINGNTIIEYSSSKEYLDNLEYPDQDDIDIALSKEHLVRQKELLVDSDARGEALKQQQQSSEQEIIDKDIENAQKLEKISEELAKNTISDQERLELEKYYTDSKNQGIDASYANGAASTLPFSKNVRKALEPVGTFNVDEEDLIDNIRIPNVLLKLFNYNDPTSVIKYFNSSIVKFLHNHISKQELDNILNGKSDLPIHLQMFFKPVLDTNTGKFKLELNQNFLLKVMLASMQTTINHYQNISSNNVVDIAKDAQTTPEALKNAPVIFDKDSGEITIYSGKAYIEYGAKHTSLDIFRTDLANNLIKFTGLNVSKDTQANNEAIQKFFNEMAYDLISIYEEDHLLDVDSFNLGNGNIAQTVAVSGILKQLIELSIPSGFTEIDEQSLIEEKYNSVIPKSIVSDFFIDNSYKSISDTIGEIGKEVFNRKHPINSYTTPQAQEWLNILNKTPYLMNHIMYNSIQGKFGLSFWQAMGDVFALDESFDKNYTDSLRGRRNNIRLAIESALEIAEEIIKYSEHTGIPVEKVAKYYEHRQVSNGRAQEMEAFGPSVDKLVRELLSPNRVIINLTDPDTLNLYRASIAQAFGVNLGKNTLDTIINKANQYVDSLNAIINSTDDGHSQLRHLISDLQQLNEGKSIDDIFSGKDPQKVADLTKILISELGGDYESPASFRALLSLLKYNNLVNNNGDLTQFESFDWIEVDGTNHGPGHTLTHFSLDYSNVPAILASIGIFVGSTDVNQMNRAEILNSDGNDLDADMYTGIKDTSVNKLNESRANQQAIANPKNTFIKKNFYQAVVRRLTNNKINSKNNSINENIAYLKENTNFIEANNTINGLEYFLKIALTDKSEKVHLTVAPDGSITFDRDWAKPWVTQGSYMSRLNGLTNNALKYSRRGFSKFRNNVIRNLGLILENENPAFKGKPKEAMREAHTIILEGSWFITDENTKETTGVYDSSTGVSPKALLGRAIKASLNPNINGDVLSISNEEGRAAFDEFITNLDNSVNAALQRITLTKDLERTDDKRTDLSSLQANSKTYAFYGEKTKFKNFGVNLLRYGWNYFKSEAGSVVYDTVFSNVKNYVMYPTNLANEEVMRKNSNIVTSQITNTSVGLVYAYNAIIFRRIQKMKREGNLTRGNLKKLYNSLKGIDSIYETEDKFIQYTLRENSSIPLTENKLNTGKKTRKARIDKFDVNVNESDVEAGNLHTYTTITGKTYNYLDTFEGMRDPGVGAVAVTTHANTDVTMSQLTAKEIASLNEYGIQRLTHAHDGYHTALDLVKTVADAANNAIKTTLFRNPLVSFLQKQLTFVGLLKEPDSIVKEEISNLFNTVSDAIKNNTLDTIPDQQLLDYLNILKQFIRPSNEGATEKKEFGLDYSARGMSDFLNELSQNPDQKRLYQVYAKLAKGTSSSTTDAFGVTITSSDPVKGLTDIFSNPFDIVTSTRESVDNFPIKHGITFDDLMVLAEDSLNNTKQVVDYIDSLHEATKEFGLVIHHLAGNTTGVSIEPTGKYANEVAELKDKFNIPELPKHKDDFKKLGYAINKLAELIANDKLKGNSKSRANAIEPQIIETTSTEDFLNAIKYGLNKNSKSNKEFNNPEFELMTLLLKSKVAKSGTIPRLIITNSSSDTLPEDMFTHPDGSSVMVGEILNPNDKGKYVFDEDTGLSYIIVNTDAINKALPLDASPNDVLVATQQTIAHEFNHATFGETITEVFDNFRKRKSIKPRTQIEHIVTNTLSGLFVTLKSVILNKTINKKLLHEFLVQNYGEEFGGNFLYSLLNTEVSSPYSHLSEFINKFSEDPEYTKVGFIRDLVNSKYGEQFVDEAVTFMITGSKLDLENIDAQINAAALKDVNIAKNKFEFIKRTMYFLKKMGTSIKQSLKNLFMHVFKISPTKENENILKKGIETSFTKAMIANVGYITRYRVSQQNAYSTQTGSKVRNDSFINNDGTVNTSHKFDIPILDNNSTTANTVEFLADSYDKLIPIFEENARQAKNIENRFISDTQAELNQFGNIYSGASPTYNDIDKPNALIKTLPRDAIPSRYINNIVKSEKALIDNTKLKSVITNYKTVAVNSGFLNTQAKLDTFDKLFRTLVITSNLSGPTYNRLSQLMEYITDNLSYKDFLQDKENPSDQDKQEARLKFDSLVGKLSNFPGNEYNQALFYAFVCLDEDLQNIVRKLPIPDIYATETSNNILDKAMHYLTDSLMEKTTRALATKKLTGKNNNLMEEVNQLLLAYNNKTLSEKYNAEASNIVTDTVDYLDNLGSKAIGYIWNKSIEKLHIPYMNIEDPNSSKWSPLLWNDPNFGSKFGEYLTYVTNKYNKYPVLDDLIKDLVGSTRTTYPVYKLIKQAHADIQQVRSRYREDIPASIIKKFKGKYKASDYVRLTDCVESMGLVSLFDLGTNTINKLITSQSALNKHIDNCEASFTKYISKEQFRRIKHDALNLAHWMASSNKEYSHGFKYNAFAILVDHLGIQTLENEPSLEKELDQLISYYAIKEFISDSKNANNVKFMSKMLSNETEGINQILGIYNAQFEEQTNRAKDITVRLNAIKGFLGSDTRGNTHITIDKNDSATREHLESMGYTFIKNYSKNKAYYISNLPDRSMFLQGGLQSIHYAVNGVNADGYRINQVAERIYDPKEVHKLLLGEYQKDSNIKYSTERLIPVYDLDSSTGRLFIKGFERSLDYTTMKKTKPERHIAILAGITAGRMYESEASEKLNSSLIDKCLHMWKNARDKSNYVNLFDYLTKDRSPEAYRRSKDPIIADALSNLPKDLIELINSRFNTEANKEYLVKHIDEIFPNRNKNIKSEDYLETHKVFMVRKDMIKDIIGIRHPSVTDIWTGVSRWSPKTQERLRFLAESAFGLVGQKRNTYKYLYTAELGVMKTVSFARNTIVIKSVQVAVENLVANFYQLWLRGVPLTEIYRSVPDILSQLELYTRDQNALIELDAKLAATTDTAVKESLNLKKNNILQRRKHLDIAPLLDAGEFSTIADVGVTPDEMLLPSGNIIEKCNKALNSDKVPKVLSVPVKYFLVTKDTALYRFLEKSVSYGDFMAKAIRYKHLTKYKGFSSEEAMRRVSDEFVNYDRLAGRNRIYLENIGLLWFYNFKLRMLKVHLDMLKNNPARVLLNYLNPISLPTPMADSIVGKGLSGGLSYTTGLDMGLNSWRLLPFLQLFGHL